MKTSILKNGIIGGIIVSIFMGMSVYFHSQNLENEMLSYILGFSGMFIAFIFTFIGMKQYRDKVNNGSISFGKAFTIGLSIAFIISTIYVLVWLFELHNFYPDFMEKYAASEISKLQSSGLSATEIASKTAEMNQMTEYYKSPLYVIGFTYVEILPIGIFFSLLYALIVKKKAI
jgi:ethanolamine transporter EutH